MMRTPTHSNEPLANPDLGEQGPSADKEKPPQKAPVAPTAQRCLLTSTGLDPTPAEIAQRAAEIRARWSEATRRARRYGCLSEVEESLLVEKGMEHGFA